MFDKDVLEYEMNHWHEKAQENFDMYKATNDEKYLEEYYKCNDESRQYSWLLNR